MKWRWGCRGWLKRGARSRWIFWTGSRGADCSTELTEWPWRRWRGLLSILCGMRWLQYRLQTRLQIGIEETRFELFRLRIGGWTSLKLGRRMMRIWEGTGRIAGISRGNFTFFWLHARINPQPSRRRRHLRWFLIFCVPWDRWFFLWVRLGRRHRAWRPHLCCFYVFPGREFCSEPDRCFHLPGVAPRNLDRHCSIFSKEYGGRELL